MLLKDIINKGVETVSMRYPQGEAKEMVFAYIEDVFGFKRHAHILNPELQLSEESASASLADFMRMAAGEPLQYVTGKAYFYGREYKVTPSVLIPRQETEILCMEAVQAVSSFTGGCHSDFRVLDLCTGSGCIAWTMALEMPGLKVKAVDISEAALKVASSQEFSEEMAATGACSPVFLKEDVLLGPDNSTLSEEKYDVIVSNPPYVMESEKAQMRANVLEHEPHLALFVPDEDPLKFYRAVASWAASLLSEKGVGIVEINEALGNETAEVFKKAGFDKLEIIRDLHEKERFVKFSHMDFVSK